MDGVNIQILEPRKEFALVLSVRSIISGDVRAIDSCAMKRTTDDSVVSEYHHLFIYLDTKIIELFFIPFFSPSYSV